MIVDVKGLLMGRIATFIAKKALEEEEIIVINCKDVVLSGGPKAIISHYKKKLELGNARWGPFYIRNSAMLFKKAVRGMLPWHNTRGREAYKRIKCYATSPKDLKGKPITIEEFHISKHKSPKHITLGEVSKHLGGKR